MSLRVVDEIVELTVQMREAVALIARQDADLARQLRRSWSSAALNSSEGQGQRGAKGLNRLDDAMGSAREARDTLRMSVAWGYLEQQQWVALIERVDGVVAQLYRLAHR
jgi:four helix bundle protein